MQRMGILQLNCPPISSITIPSCFNRNTCECLKPLLHLPRQPRRRELSAVAANTISGSEGRDAATEEPPSIDFAFVSPRLLPDGTLDVQYRTACGGRKLRDIMLDNHVDLYGPYDAPLSNCSGGGTCGTCIVEVVEGKELLSPRTDKEKELLKKKPKTWRLACQTTVANEDSRGQIIIQQLPEWKVHEWGK